MPGLAVELRSLRLRSVRIGRFDSVVEGAVDLGGLRRLAGLVRRRRLRAGLAAEAQVERAEVDRGAAVLADLLERLQQRVPFVRLADDRLAGRDLDVPVALQAGGRRDEL